MKSTKKPPSKNRGAQKAGDGVPNWVWALGLALAVLLAYQPAWNGKPLWDDGGHITKPELRSWDGLARIWTQPGATQQYYPVVHSVFWVEYQLWGDGPAGYHLVNILLHIASALLLVKVLQRLEVPGAWLAGAIWALHPVQVESVAWISELKNALSGVCYMASALAYLSFDRERKKRFYLLALALFVTGLLAKTVIAPLPAALLLVFWWRRDSLRWKEDVLPLIPFFAAGVGLGLFTAWMERTTIIGHEAGWQHLSLVERFLIAGRDVWFYLGKLAWPHPLIFMYPRWDVQGAAAWQYLFPLLVAAVAVGLWLMRRRIGKGPLLVFLFFVGTLFPALGFIDVYPFQYSFVADHYQYLASLGPLTLAAVGIERGLRGVAERNPRLKGILCGGLLVVLGGLTWGQCGQYTDSETLFRTVLAANPGCAMAHINLGVILMNQQKLDDAGTEFRKGLQIQPEDAEGQLDLGNVLGQKGDLPGAAAQFRKAIQVQPEFAEAHGNLGLALLQEAQAVEAAGEFRKALEIKPHYAPALEGLEQASLRTGDLDGAMAIFDKTPGLPFDPAQRWYSLGSKMLEGNHYIEASVCYRRTVALNPALGYAWAYLGVAYFQNGQTKDALEAWQKSLDINPGEPQIENNVAMALATSPDASLRNGPRAVALAEHANRATGGGNPSILSTLAAAYAEAGRFQDAIATAQRALAQARAQNAVKLAGALEDEIRLYEAGKPMRK